MISQTIVFYGNSTDSNGLHTPWKFYSVSEERMQNSNFEVKVRGFSKDCETSLIKAYLVTSQQANSFEEAVEFVAQRLISDPLHNNLSCKRGM